MTIEQMHELAQKNGYTVQSRWEHGYHEVYRLLYWGGSLDLQPATDWLVKDKIVKLLNQIDTDTLRYGDHISNLLW